MLSNVYSSMLKAKNLQNGSSYKCTPALKSRGFSPELAKDSSRAGPAKVKSLTPLEHWSTVLSSSLNFRKTPIKPQAQKVHAVTQSGCDHSLLGKVAKLHNVTSKTPPQKTLQKSITPKKVAMSRVEQQRGDASQR